MAVASPKGSNIEALRYSDDSLSIPAAHRRFHQSQFILQRIFSPSDARVRRISVGGTSALEPHSFKLSLAHGPPLFSRGFIQVPAAPITFVKSWGHKT